MRVDRFEFGEVNNKTKQNSRKSRRRSPNKKKTKKKVDRRLMELVPELTSFDGAAESFHRCSKVLFFYDYFPLIFL